MDLRVERVEDPHPVARREQPIGDEGADEAGAAGDEDVHGEARNATPAAGTAANSGAV
jgi:hypothetical protein